MEALSPQHILCPVDFSETSALGLRFAAALARCSGAKLTVLYADQFLPPAYFTHDHLEEISTRLAGAKAEAEQSLGEFVRRVAGLSEIPMSARVIEALPVDGIIRVTGELPADIIAMGTHGRSGFNRLMLGSVTERVLRTSSIPVLTVRPGRHGPEPFPSVRNVVCPVNNSGSARRALGYAARLSHCLGAELTVLHVREPGARDGIDDLCAWIPEETRKMCSVREVTRQGEAAQVIISAAVESSCDLLVLGARHRTFFDSTVIGTTSVRVVRHAPCAVLTVPVMN
ncbi:MAG: universal stress protein [Bryobacteraceae bacterium]